MKMIPALLFACCILPLEAQSVWTLRYQSELGQSVSAACGHKGFYLVSVPDWSDPPPYLSTYYKSTNGIQWASVKLPYSFQMKALQSGCLAAGWYGTVYKFHEAGGYTKVFGSPDYQGTCIGFANGNGCWIAAFEDGRIYRATVPEGPWTRQLSPATWFDGVAFGNGTFVASINGTNVLTSTDGINWSLRDATNSYNMLGFGAGSFYTSFSRSSGENPVWPRFSPRPADTLLEISTEGPAGVLFATDYQGMSYTSDFTTWVKIPPVIPGKIKALSFCGDLWLAAADGALIITSPDATLPPLAAPPVTITPAVDLTWPSILGRQYQVQGSDDNKTWGNLGLSQHGNGSPLRYTAPTTGARKFFRIETR